LVIDLEPILKQMRHSERSEESVWQWARNIGNISNNSEILRFAQDDFWEAIKFVAG
jgi:hypothetical protein